MTCNEVMAELKAYGNEQTVKIYRNHGANMDMYGVKVGDLKKIQKKTKINHELAQELYATLNTDAMYLACLIADKKQTTPELLNQWVAEAKWYLIGEYVVAQLAADSGHVLEVAPNWITSDKEYVASSGWSAYSNYLSLVDNENVDTQFFADLIKQVEEGIKDAPNRVRYAMNGFIIAAGSYVPELCNLAQAAAKRIGKVEVNMGNTSCKVPAAYDYIEKIKLKDRLGKKRKKPVVNNKAP